MPTSVLGCRTRTPLVSIEKEAYCAKPRRPDGHDTFSSNYPYYLGTKYYWWINITVTAKATGSDVYESLHPSLTLDLSNERTALISEYSIESLNFTPDAAGDDFTVTITQWERV